MPEPLLDQILTFTFVILTLTVTASVQELQYSESELLNQNGGFKLATIRTAALPESTAAIVNEDLSENVTEVPYWSSTQFNDMLTEDLSSPVSASTEMLTTEEATVVDSTAASVSTEVLFTTEEATAEESPTVTFMDSSVEATTLMTTAETFSYGEPTQSELRLDDTTLFMSSTVREETWAAESVASTEMTSYWATSAGWETTLMTSIATEADTTVSTTTPHTETPFPTSDSIAAMTTNVNMSTVAIASETVASEWQTSLPVMETTVSKPTTTAHTLPPPTIPQLTTQTSIEGTTLVSSFSSTNPALAETTMEELLTTAVPTATIATLQAATQTSTEAITLVSTFSSIINPTSTVTAAEELLTMTMPISASATSTKAMALVSTFSSIINPTSTVTATEEFLTTAVPTGTIATLQSTTQTSTEATTLVSTFSSIINRTSTVTVAEQLLTMTMPTDANATVQPITQTSTNAIALLSTSSSTNPTSTVRTTEESPVTAISYEMPSTTAGTTSRRSVMETTTTLSTSMPTTTVASTTVAPTTKQSVTSNRPTTAPSMTPEIRISQRLVDTTLEELEQKNFTVQTVGKIAEQLANVTTNAEVLSLSAAVKATKIVANISDLILNSNFTKEFYPVPKLIGQIAAGLMNLNSTDLASVESQSKVSVQQSLETSLSALALAAMQNGSTINETYLKLQDDNLAFQVIINPSISGIKISSETSLSQATLEMVPYENATVSSASSSPTQSRNETLVQLSSLVAQSPKTFLVYNSAKLFQAKDGLQPDNNGRVVSAQLPGSTIKAQGLIKIVFPPMQSNLERKCGYWNYSAKAWSTEGCNPVIGNDNSVTCTCDHLTNFAVLLAVNNVPSSTELDILSTIGLSISGLSLAAVVITFIAIKKMRRTVSQKVLFNLALSLLILDLLFLFGIDKTSSRNGCIAIAALLHYFLLTSFMWMLMESILQYLRFVKVLGTYIPRFLPKTVVPAWGIPAVIVAIVSGVDVGLYDGGANLYCMAQKEVIYYAILLPIGIILVINWTIFIVVLKSFCCHRRLAYQSKRSESSLAKLHAQAGVAVCTLLGLTWVFGFLTAIPDATTSVAFQWLFCICNTLQGFIIFLFHCVRENVLRKELRKLCCRCGPLAATPLSEDSSSASKTASSLMSRSQSVSMATMNSSSMGGSSILSSHKGSYSFTDAEHRTRHNSEIP